jgi:hypothetical protein
MLEALDFQESYLITHIRSSEVAFEGKANSIVSTDVSWHYNSLQLLILHSGILCIGVQRMLSYDSLKPLKLICITACGSNGPVYHSIAQSIISLTHGGIYGNHN